MPYMKMTAKKSTGGRASRVELSAPVDVSNDGQSRSQSMDVYDVVEHNDYCIVCRDGSVDTDLLFCCEECPRVTCGKCLDVPQHFREAVAGDDVTFTCICCHIAMQQKNGPPHKPYFGFYKNGQPVLPKFVPILATLEISQRAQISSTPVLFIHLKLVDCDTACSPFVLAYNFLRPYFPRGGIEFQEVEFDVGTSVNTASYVRTAGKILRGVMKRGPWERLVIGITNHTDDESGDPFAG
ncbi:hypothetical protein BDR04DRAFT_1165183, partial [Suillus decipiens]